MPHRTARRSYRGCRAPRANARPVTATRVGPQRARPVLAEQRALRVGRVSLAFREFLEFLVDREFPEFLVDRA